MQSVPLSWSLIHKVQQLRYELATVAVQRRVWLTLSGLIRDDCMRGPLSWFLKDELACSGQPARCFRQAPASCIKCGSLVALEHRVYQVTGRQEGRGRTWRVLHTTFRSISWILQAMRGYETGKSFESNHFRKIILTVLGQNIKPRDQEGSMNNGPAKRCWGGG